MYHLVSGSLPCIRTFLSYRLHGLFYVPDKCPHADFLVPAIELVHSLEQFFHLVVVHDGNDGGVHFRPRVRAAARLPAVGAASLHLFKKRETAYLELVEHVFDTLRIGLVEYDKYSFHCSIVLFLWVINRPFVIMGVQLHEYVFFLFLYGFVSFAVA